MRENDNMCPRCWGKYKLDERPRPVSIRSWERTTVSEKTETPAGGAARESR